ncbi:zinc ribbon domain-containing protein [Actinomadura nitritigenes]|uniref:zinc ribbon domain-containing protein n=1 Tax=Actinomadura nitritigenes TaxID=134602 RepID=UPI0035592B76
MYCGYCERRMQGNWNNDQAYYRCRFPAEDALANKIVHPKVVYLREAEIIEDIDAWLATAFSPARIQATIAAMTEQASATENPAETRLRKQLAACDQRLTQYRAALNAGADAVHVAKWINETEQERQRVEGELRAVPTDQVDLYSKLGLTMTYYPEKNLWKPGWPRLPHVQMICVRGAVTTNFTCPPPPPSATSTASRCGLSEPHQPLVVGAPCRRHVPRTRSDAIKQQCAKPWTRPEVKEPRADLGERLVLAQIGQDRQRLLPGVEQPPPRPDDFAPAADQPGDVVQR